MSDQPPTGDAGATLRHLTGREADTLTELTATFEDLTLAMACCERLLTELDQARDDGRDSAGAPDAPLLQALWNTALLAYVRCFATDERPRGLTLTDLTSTPLEGKVVEWHQTLRKLRDHVVAHPSPHETFSVGAAQDEHGAVAGIAIVSGQAPVVDEVAVRETGRLAYELSRLVDQRIKDAQHAAYEHARALPDDQLEALPMLRVQLPT